MNMLRKEAYWIKKVTVVPYDVVSFLKFLHSALCKMEKRCSDVRQITTHLLGATIQANPFRGSLTKLIPFLQIQQAIKFLY